MSWVEREEKQDGGRSPGKPGKGILEMQADYPALAEYLVLEVFPDGTSRERSTLVVFVEDGLIKVCLSDRHYDRTLWASCETFEDCFASLDAALRGPGADWRRSSWKAKKKK